MPFRLRCGGHDFDLPLGTTYVGRSLDCQVTLDDPQVSRRQAAVVVDETGACIANVGTREGVAVDGVHVVQPTRLTHGATIAIGSERLVFLVVNEASVGAAT